MPKRKDYCDLSRRQKHRRILKELSCTKNEENVLIEEQRLYQDTSESGSEDQNNSSTQDFYPADENLGTDIPGFVGPSTSVEDSVKNDEEEQSIATDLKDDLRVWASNHNVTQSCLSDLLKVLIKHKAASDLPTDARTLMKTPRLISSKITSLAGGMYIHFGLTNRLCIFMKQNPAPHHIAINLNIDGLPIAHSSGGQFWPILASLVDVSQYTRPFAIGIFYGTAKPENTSFLLPFMNEFQDLQKNGGFTYNGRCIPIKINAIICDAPAKAFISGIKNHTGYFGCSKCICEGDFIDNRVVFSNLNSPLRTDDSFKNKTQPEHHRSASPLEKIGIGMVSQLPLDYMHLVCLGVMKKLLQFWVKGRLDVRLKLDKLQEASVYYVSLKRYVTKEFARYPRSFLDVERWKATEFRLFLLYLGPVVMKDVLSKTMFEHFICFSVSIRILCDQNYYLELNDYANSLLLFFVKRFSKIYGLKYVSYNVHNLIHLCADVKLFGPLDTFSAFKYENYMYKLKKKLQQSSNPLHQISNRLQEEMCQPPVLEKFPKIYLDSENTVRYVDTSDWRISAKEPDNCFILGDGRIVILSEIFYSSGDVLVKGNTFSETYPFFTSPCDSRLIGISIIKRKVSEASEIINLSCLQRKCMAVWLIPNKSEYVIIPLTHGKKDN